MPEKHETPLLIALSGPTSSGKTTIAAALKTIFTSSPNSPGPSISILHADDFFKPGSQIPIGPTGAQDWDCAAALDLPKFRSTLQKIKDGGEVPAKLIKQGGVEDGVHAHKKSGLNQEFLEKARSEVAEWPSRIKERKQRVVLVEGFLLFGQGVQDDLASLFDLKILLRASRGLCMQRRQSRNGYVTLEGFWQDPEGYFEDVVWPNFVSEHKSLFEEGEVEGKIKSGSKEGVLINPVLDAGLEETCKWVLGCLKGALQASEP